MLITEKITIKVINFNLDKLKSIGYSDIKIGDDLTISTNELSYGSSYKIDVKCDVCGDINSVIYRNFYKSRTKYGYDTCIGKCSQNKAINTSLEKYGETYYSKTDEYKEKKIESCLEKYGIPHATTEESINKAKETCKIKFGEDSIFKTNGFKESRIQTSLEKYGEICYSKTDESKERNKNINMEKYGEICYTKTDECKEKTKITNIEKYGVDSYSKTDEFIDKVKKTSLERFGVDSYSKTEEFITNYKKNSLEKWGVEFPLMTREWIQKSLIKKGLDFETDEYIKFRRKVVNLSKKVKKELFDNWDGRDFYDNEYIKDNFSLHPNNRDYPTVDHKISVFEGYKNNTLPEELAKIDNLCITKRWINSSKNNKSNWILKS